MVYIPDSPDFMRRRPYPYDPMAGILPPANDLQLPGVLPTLHQSSPTAPVGALGAGVPSSSPYQLPAAPMMPTYDPAPVRDVRGDSRDSLQKAVISAILGGLAGGVEGATAGATGAMGSAARRHDADFASNVGKWKAGNAVKDSKYKQDVAGYEHDKDALDLRIKTDGIAADGAERQRVATRQEQQDTRQAGIDAGNEQQGKDKLKQQFYENLQTLTPLAQQEAIKRAQQDGSLDRMGASFPVDDKGLFIVGMKTQAQQNVDDTVLRQTQAKAQAKVDARETEERKVLTGRLQNDYKLLTNDKLTKAGAIAIGKRITASETKLGLHPGGDGSEYSKFFDTLSPKDKEQIRQHNQTYGLSLKRFEFAKQEAGKRDAYRAQTLAARTAGAKTAAQKAIAKAGGDSTKAFNQNQHRLSDIKQQISGALDEDSRAALEYEYDQLTDQQGFLAPKASALSPTAKQKVVGATAALESKTGNGFKPYTVNGQTFKVRVKPSGGAK